MTLFSTRGRPAVSATGAMLGATALTAALFAVVLVSPSQAADECGPGTSVTCSGNYSATGISYGNANQSVVLTGTASLLRTNNSGAAVSLTGSGTQSFDSTAVSRVSGGLGNVIDITNATSDITVRANSVTSTARNTGTNLTVINTRSTAGTILVDVGDIFIGRGDEMVNAIFAESGSAGVPTGGNVTVRANGFVTMRGDAEGPSTFDVRGITARSFGGDVDVQTAGEVYAYFRNGIGILADSVGGDSLVRVTSTSKVIGGWDGAAQSAAAIVVGGNTARIVNEGTIGETPSPLTYTNSNGVAIATADMFGGGAAGALIIENRAGGTLNGTVRLNSTSTEVINQGLWNFVQIDADHSGGIGFYGGAYSKDIAVADFGSNATFNNSGVVRLFTVPKNISTPYVPDPTGAYVPAGLDPAHYTITEYGREQGQFQNLKTFVNSGTIDMTELVDGDPFADLYKAGAAGDVFVITGGTTPGTDGGGVYVSNGGRLKVDVEFNQGGAASHADMLVVDSTAVAAGGATRIEMKPLGTSASVGGRTEGDGIKLVEVQGTSAAGAFVLDGRFAQNIWEYKLIQGGILDPSDGDWYLRSDIRGIGFVGTALPRLALTYSSSLFDGYAQRRDASDAAAAAGNGVWMRALGARGSVSSRDSATRGGGFDYGYGGIQLGFDTFRSQDDSGSNQAGLTLSYAKGSADVAFAASNATGTAGTASFDAYSAGGYWTHTGTEGWYVDLVGQGTWFADLGGTATEGDKLTTRGWLLGASLEAGMPFALGNGFTITPQAQLAYQYGQLGDGVETFSKVAYSGLDSTRATLGVDLSHQWIMDEEQGRMLTTTLSADLVGEFGARPTTTFSNRDGSSPARLAGDLGGYRVDIGVGMSATLSESVALSANAKYSLDLKDHSQTALAAGVGAKVLW